MKVAIVAASDWSLLRFRRELIDTCHKAGLEVAAIADLNEEQGAHLSETCTQVVSLPIDAAGTNPIKDITYTIRMMRVLSRLRPDVVHLFNTKPSIFGVIAAKMTRVPVIIVTITGRGILASERARMLSLFVGPLLKWALRGRTHCIVQNTDDERWLTTVMRIDESRVMRVPGSGVNTNCLRPDATVAPEARRTFVLAARMLWSKGIADFVEAARMVRSRFADADFVLFGGAKEDYDSRNPDFIDRAWLEALNREGVVSWRGFTAPHVVEDAMRQAAAVVLPSYYAEGVPRALIEGAAAGSPIITTDMPGCRDCVDPGKSGFVVPPRSPSSLAEAMCTLLADPVRMVSMGRESRRLAVATFDSLSINDKLLSLYETLVGRALYQPADEVIRGAQAPQLKGSAS